MNDDASTSSTTSPTLICRVQQLDQDAWQQLTRLYGPLVFHWCKRLGITGEDAADLFQEVFIAVARSIHRFRPHRQPGTSRGTFRGWLWTITRNKALDHLRWQRHHDLATGGTQAQLLLAQLEEAYQVMVPAEIRRWSESVRRERSQLKLGWTTMVIGTLGGETWSVQAIDAIYEIASRLPTYQLDQQDAAYSQFILDAQSALEEVDAHQLIQRMIRELSEGDSTTRAFTLAILEEKTHADEMNAQFSKAPNKILEALLAASRDSNPIVALRALQKITESSARNEIRVAQRLREAVAADDESFASRAAYQLALVAPTNQQLIEKLKTWSHSARPILQYRSMVACEIVAQHHDMGVELILSALEHPKWGLEHPSTGSEAIRSMLPREVAIASLQNVTRLAEKVGDRLEKEISHENKQIAATAKSVLKKFQWQSEFTGVR